MRVAIIDVAGDMLAECAGILTDSGLAITGSVNSPWPDCGLVRLTVSGDVLPDECDNNFMVVKVLFTTEHYGNQKISRVERFTVVGPVVAMMKGV